MTGAYPEQPGCTPRLSPWTMSRMHALSQNISALACSKHSPHTQAHQYMGRQHACTRARCGELRGASQHPHGTRGAMTQPLSLNFPAAGVARNPIMPKHQSSSSPAVPPPPRLSWMRYVTQCWGRLHRLVNDVIPRAAAPAPGPRSRSNAICSPRQP